MTPPAEGRPPGERPSPRTASQAPAEVAALLAEPGEWSFSRASGPGGQRRDHAETRAVLMVTATALEDLPERIAARLAAGPGLARRPLRLSSRAGRSRERNRLAVIARLERRVAAAPAPPPAPRRPTRPSRAARERRLAGKARRPAVTAARRGGGLTRTLGVARSGRPEWVVSPTASARSASVMREQRRSARTEACPPAVRRVRRLESERGDHRDRSGSRPAQGEPHRRRHRRPHRRGPRRADGARHRRRAPAPGAIAVVRVPSAPMGQARRRHREDPVAEPTRIQQRLRWHLRPLDPEPEAPARSLGHRVRLERVAERLEAMEDTRAPRMAAEVLAEVAGVGRFADPAKLPRSAGLVPCRRPRGRVGAVASIGPATVSSTAPFTGSPSSRPACTARPAGTSRRIAEGETEREARRCRTRHPVNVIFRALAQRAGSLSTGGRLPVAAALT